jgi:GH15 family glucan-1,4-alpha-glucosidase
VVRVQCAVQAEFKLLDGDSAVFLLQEIEPGANCEVCMSPQEAQDAFINTVNYWRRWISGCTYTGRWRETLHGSALVLKLLTYEPTGTIVAAPTAGLPESIGGERNWDYRYTWIRDAAFTLYGLLRIGFTEEAAAFMQWLEARSHEPNPDGSLQIMFGIEGRQLMDPVYLYNKHGNPISYDLWVCLRRLIDYVCENWQRKDEGIWEVRSGRRHFVFSKLMCWVALDRGLRLADKRSFPADRSRWLKVRDQMYEEIMSRG